MIELERKISEGEFNQKTTQYNLNVWIGRYDAAKELDLKTPKIKEELKIDGEREIATITCHEGPSETSENLRSVRFSSSDGVLKVEKTSLGGSEFSEEILVPAGRLDYLIGNLHPKIIIDFTKQFGEK